MKKEYDFSKAKKTNPAKNIKVIKTFRIDADVLQWLEQQGEKEGMGYQTYLNWYLRKSMSEKDTLEKRLSKLESLIFKKHG